MRVAIIGCGLIGNKRAQSLAGCTLAVCCDAVVERARTLAATVPGAEASDDWRQVVARPDIDIVMAATTHDLLAPIATEAAKAGKHVLIEKPGARSSGELAPVANAARRGGVAVRVGCNHRYHRALQKAREIYESGALGELMFVRGRYGHGGRPGYEKEWRADAKRSGGGELVDQGIHLIDLARWFLGDFVRVQGHIATYFWDTPVEDNGFLLLTTAEGQAAHLHATWTEWKNMFSFEIYGRLGKLEITGLGGSYGLERLAYYAMSPEMGPPETTIWEYPMADDSWTTEFKAFLDDIRLGRTPEPGIAEADAALRIIEEVYEDARRNSAKSPIREAVSAR
jgi:predicted dehydrogenase